MTTHAICKHPESIRDQSPTSQRYNQSFVKELAKPTQDKIVFNPESFRDPTLQKK
jgi:hypothetical protein